MNKGSSRSLMIGMFLLGFSIAAGYFLLVHPGLGTTWKQEQPPPEPISSLDLGPNGEVIGQGSSGNSYEVLPAYDLPWETYIKAEQNKMGVFCSAGNRNGYIIRRPPGKVISHVGESCVATESGFYMEVVLLENGEVWSWRNESNSNSGMILFIGLFCVFGLGLALLIIGMIVKDPQKPDNTKTYARQTHPSTGEFVLKEAVQLSGM